MLAGALRAFSYLMRSSRGCREGWSRRFTTVALAVALTAMLPVAGAAAAEYTVNSTGDETDEAIGSGGCSTTAATCTLRAAIEESNASPEIDDTITFSAVFDGQVADTIELATSLPTITDRVDIEGYPRPLDCETDYFSHLGPCVGIDGPPGGTAFRVAAERVLLIGFAISGAKTGVEAVGAPVLRAWNNWFGLELDGSAGPLETGLSVDQNSNGLAVGLSTNAGNIFAHNTNAGLQVNGADYASVRGNGFGVLPDGNTPAANGVNIEIADAASGENRVAHGNWIGGIYHREDPDSTICDVWCNVISGATEAGIDLSGDGADQDPASGSTRIFGNYIGLNAFGTAGVPNAQQAIRVGAAENVTIGGPRTVERNLINGGLDGVLAGPDAGNLVVENNWVGLNATGASMLAPPSNTGIKVEDGWQVRIIGNRISMATGTAIDQSAPEVVLRGNEIGKGVNGEDLPGGSVGIRLDGNCGFCNLVEGNVLANANEHGLLIEGDGNQVFGNRIEGAGAAGILVFEDFGAILENVIGADSGASENTISGNGGAAIEIRDEGPHGEAFRNFVGRNRGAMNGGPFIYLPEGTNRGILQPSFARSTQAGAEGHGAEPGATIRVFRKAGVSPGELEGFLADALADEDGNWAVAYPRSIPGGTIVAATQTSADVGTSELSFATTTVEPTEPSGPVEPKGGGSGADGRGGGAPLISQPPAADTTRPRTILRKRPRTNPHSRTAKVRFTSSERGSRFQCKLDRGPVRRCRSPKKYKRLRPGRHVFRVWAIDAAGNKDRSPAKRSFRIRAQASTAASASAPGNWTLALPAKLTRRECNPPAETFYYSLATLGLHCSAARRVLTSLRCTNLPRCSKLRYRAWRCRVKGGIAERTTRCWKGPRRIVAHAGGD